MTSPSDGRPVSVLSAEEWAALDPDVRSNLHDCFDGYAGRIDRESLPRVIALANSACGLITWEMVDAIRAHEDDCRGRASNGADKLTDPALTRIADTLASLLPPRTT